MNILFHHTIVLLDLICLVCNIGMTYWTLYYYDYSQCNYEDMKIYLAGVDWRILLNCDAVLEVFVKFVKMMKDLVMKFVPRKMRKTVKKPLRWNKQIQNQRRKTTISWDSWTKPEQSAGLPVTIIH